MIEIRSSPTADSRTCDVTQVSKDQLLESSRQHISDVWRGLTFFMDELSRAGINHDPDKIDDIDGFYENFQNRFGEGHTDWWERHRQKNRHHLNYPDGVRDDVNLIDVLDYVTDCVMAGMARSGDVYDVQIDPAVLFRAFKNTIELLKKQVKVVE